MAIVQVPMTSESLAYLQRIVDSVVDTSEPDYVQRNFKQLVSCLHYQCAGVGSTWDPATRTLTLDKPTEAQEAVKVALDDLMNQSAKSQTSSPVDSVGSDPSTRRFYL